MASGSTDATNNRAANRADDIQIVFEWPAGYCATRQYEQLIWDGSQLTREPPRDFTLIVALIGGLSLLPALAGATIHVTSSRRQQQTRTNELVSLDQD